MAFGLLTAEVLVEGSIAKACQAAAFRSGALRAMAPITTVDDGRGGLGFFVVGARTRNVQPSSTPEIPPFVILPVSEAVSMKRVIEWTAIAMLLLRPSPIVFQ